MRILRKVIFWVGVIFLLTLIFGSSQGNYVESFYFVSLLLPVIVGTSYFFNDFLVPRYLFKRRLGKFLLYTFYMIIFSMYLELWAITLAFIYLANYQYHNMIPVTTNVFVLAITLYCIVFLYGFILLARRYFLHQQTIQELEEAQDKQKMDCLVVRVDRKMKKVFLKDILYLESLADYVKIHTSTEGIIITKEKISKLGEKLPSVFLRIHRSFIVNVDQIKSFTREEIQMDKKVELPISRTYKKAVMEALQIRETT